MLRHPPKRVRVQDYLWLALLSKPSGGVALLSARTIDPRTPEVIILGGVSTPNISDRSFRQVAARRLKVFGPANTFAGCR